MTGDRVPLPPDLDACPLLGLPNDPSTHFAFAHRAHLCHATPKPAAVDVTYQARFCLTAGFPACDRYRAWAAGVAATAGPPPEPEMVGVMESVAARAAVAQETAAPVIQPAAEPTVTPDVAFAPPGESVGPAEFASPAVALAASPVAEPPIAEPPIAEPPIAEPVIAEAITEQPPVPDPSLAVPAIAEVEVAEPPAAGALFAETTAERRVAEPTLGAPPNSEPIIAKPPIPEPPLADSAPTGRGPGRFSPRRPSRSPTSSIRQLPSRSGRPLIGRRPGDRWRPR